MSKIVLPIYELYYVFIDIEAPLICFMFVYTFILFLPWCMSSLRANRCTLFIFIAFKNSRKFCKYSVNICCINLRNSLYRKHMDHFCCNMLRPLKQLKKIHNTYHLNIIIIKIFLWHINHDLISLYCGLVLSFGILNIGKTNFFIFPNY